MAISTWGLDLAEGYSGIGGDVWSDHYHPWAARRDNIAERLFMMGVMNSLQTLCRERQFYMEKAWYQMDFTMGGDRMLHRIKFSEPSDGYNVFIFQLSNNSLFPPEFMLDIEVDLERGTIEHRYRKKYDLGVGPDRYMSWDVIKSSMTHFFDFYEKASDSRENGIQGRIRGLFKKRPAYG